MVRQRLLILRVAAFLSAGVFAVHEGRYRLAFGSEASAALGAQGHGYVPVLGVAVAVLVAIAVGQWLHRVASGRRETPIGPGRLGVLLALVLLGIYSGQELLEGALSPGRPGGLEGVFGSGGWLAFPLATAVGLLGGRLLAAASRSVAEPTGWVRLVTVVASAERLWRPAAPPTRAPAAPLARHLAGRAPPQRWI